MVLPEKSGDLVFWIYHLGSMLSRVSAEKYLELLVPGTAFKGTKSFLQPIVVCVSTAV